MSESFIPPCLHASKHCFTSSLNTFFWMSCHRNSNFLPLNSILSAQFVDNSLSTSFSSFLEAGETAVNHSPTAPLHCRQPSSFTFTGADRQGGQARLDLLEKGEADGFPSHPRTKIETKDRSCWFSSCVFPMFFIHFSALGNYLRRAER